MAGDVKQPGFALEHVTEVLLAGDRPQEGDFNLALDGSLLDQGALLHVLEFGDHVVVFSHVLVLGDQDERRAEEESNVETLVALDLFPSLLLF